VRAGISYALTEAMDEGHCGLPSDEPMSLAAQLLEVPQDLIRTALDLELVDGTVTAARVGDKPCVFLAGLYRAERNIADRLLQLRNGKLPWPWIDPDKAIPWIEQRTGLVFAESQRSAVVLALTWEFAGEMQKLSAGKFHAPQERRVARLRLWIILRQTREYDDAAHALALLRVCCERPRRRRAAKRG
jgi:hypothetical protein